MPYDSHKIFEIWEGKKDIVLDEKKVISQLCLKDGITLFLDSVENQDSTSRSSKQVSINSKTKSSFPLTDSLKLNIQSQPQTQSQTQLSKWLSSSESFHQDQFKSSSSRPQSSVRRNISSQSDLPTLDNIDNDQFSSSLQPQNQLQSQSRIQPHYQASHNSNGATGICGLTNLGNTCFFNSALQCILHSDLLIDYMRSGKYKSDLAPRNPLGTKCQLVNAFATLISRIYTQKVTIEAPKEILSIIASYAPHFAGFAQQDAHELLIFFLDLLHEDMNRVKQNYTKQPQQQQQQQNGEKSDDDIQGDGTNDQIIAQKAWSRYKSKNDSIIVDLFHGLLRSQLVCPVCNKKVVIFEPFVTLSLPIPGPLTKTPEFLFVPYDPLEPKVRMSIPLTFGLNTLCFKQNLNAELGRNFDIALCVRSHSTGSFEWTNVLPTKSSVDFIVFEVPDVRNSFYAVCSITVNRKKGFFSSLSSWLGESPQIVEDIILVPINKTYIENEELEKICEKRLEFLWDKEKREAIPMNSELIEYISTCENFPEEIKKKFTAEIVTTFFDRSLLFEKSKIFPFILNKTIKITLNPAFMKDYFGFNWANLIRPVKNVDPKNDEIVAPTLENCIKQFCLATVLDENNMWYCPHCKEFVKANKKTSIWSLPRCLVFQFKRFTQYYNTFRKREGKIDFPQIIDLEQFIKGPVDPSKTKYRLYAVCEHYGSMTGGHYVAHAYVEEKKHWYLFNDSSCRPSNEQDAHNEAAYLLFYERIED